jgi:3'(2'), 5'-bisphosphate nucleotidase
LSFLDPLEMDHLIATAREAGEAVMTVYRGDFAVHNKADASPVTAADLRAHEVIQARLEERYPEIPILSEESREQAPYEVRRRWEAFWLVDPLDGTKEFIKRNGQFTINIALIEGSRPTAGVVYAPALGLLYYANDKAGAFKTVSGGKPVRLGGPPERDSEHLVIAGSLSHPTPAMDAFVEEQRRQYEQVEFIARGSSLKICMVADGQADVYPRLGATMEWDTAAAHAVATAAGRRVLGYESGEELRYNKPDLRNDWFVVR